MRSFPYCPNEDCLNHHVHKKTRKWYVHKGSYTTGICGTQPRFMCRSCGRTFSARTFHINYYTKKSIDYYRLYTHLKTSSGIRDIARDFNCTTSTVQNRILRLARQVWGAEALYHQNLCTRENLCADGLESFVESQFFQSNINVLVGSNSQFIYDFNAFYFKRKGRMTEKQKETRKTLYSSALFEKGGASRSFSEILDEVHRLHSGSRMKTLVLDTDENPVYRYCLRNHEVLKEKIRQGDVIHRLTNSKKARNYRNKLFPCNYIDRQIRKDLAEHVRETVQFSRDINNSIERFAVYRFWHNYRKPFRINRGKSLFTTHAQEAGVDKEIVGNIVHSVFKGYRIPFSLISDRLSFFKKRSWLRLNYNPRGISSQYLPRFLS